VLDAMMFVFIHRYNVTVLEAAGVANIVDRYIDEYLSQRWMHFSTSCCPSTYLAGSDAPEFDDETFYRQSIAFIEYRTISQFRNGIDPYYVDNKSQPIIRNIESAAFATKYFRRATSLSAIAVEPRAYKTRLDEYDNTCAGPFLRTVAFIHLLRSGARSTEISAPQMLSLLNNTMRISELAHIEELRNFFGSPQRDSLVNYLAQAVISDCSMQNIDQHKLRRALQEIVIERFNGDLIAFADVLWASSKNVARHLWELCNEAFLVQLFFLFKEPEMVFEARAQMLDWYARRFGDPSVSEWAKTLRLDQKLRKIRGEIDDNRIYVDPLRFGQWLLANQVGGIAKVEQIEAKDIDEFRAFGDFAFNRQPHIQMAISLQTAFSEFCGDKRYGIDSYLGRRIRHGTLKGVMLVQLQSLLARPRYQSLLSEPSVSEFVHEWFRQYESNIEFWGKEIFQVASKLKPRGAINADITNPEKIVVTRIALHDLVNYYKEGRHISQINQATFEHCWRLVEKDLLAIRLFIDSQRLSWGTMDRVELQYLASDDLQTQAREFCRELNTLTDEKFRALSRWFTRPANLAPSATIQLLLDATLDEMKGHFPDFEPQIERSGLADLELIGMYYHHVYDFMYVVIYNAAKHGKRNGRLVEEIAVLPGVVPGTLEIGIASEICEQDTIEQVRESIDAAMSGDIEDAMVVEGRSGLKKLLRMSTDIREIKSIDVSYIGRFVRFKCVLALDFLR